MEEDLPLTHRASFAAQVELIGELGAVAVVEDRLAEDLRIHAADERIPVEAVEFGTRAILRAMEANQ